MGPQEMPREHAKGRLAPGAAAFIAGMLLRTLATAETRGNPGAARLELKEEPYESFRQMDTGGIEEHQSPGSDDLLYSRQDIGKSLSDQDGL